MVREKSLIVFGGSVKSLHLIKELKPDVVFWQDEIFSKKICRYLNNIEHSSNDIICVNWPFITPESLLSHGNIYTIHESLLPSFSGCAPVNWSIIEGSLFLELRFFVNQKK